MKYQQKIKVWLMRTILIAVVGLLALPIVGQTNEKMDANQTPEPNIQITLVPEWGQEGYPNNTIKGKVSGINLKDRDDYKVVIFAFTNTWYVQPTIASPYTAIEKDGSWEADIHLGHKYAALLVKPSYKPPSTTDTLPKPAGDVLAVAKADAKKKE